MLKKVDQIARIMLLKMLRLWYFMKPSMLTIGINSGIQIQRITNLLTNLQIYKVKNLLPKTY